MDISAILEPGLLQGLSRSLTTALLLLLPLLWLAQRLRGMVLTARATLLALFCLPLLLPVSLLGGLDPRAALAISQLPVLLLPLYLGLQRKQHRGLAEAAAGLGMGWSQRLRHILLPQYATPILIALMLATLYGLVHNTALALPDWALAAPLLLLLYALIVLAEARR